MFTLCIMFHVGMFYHFYAIVFQCLSQCALFYQKFFVNVTVFYRCLVCKHGHQGYAFNNFIICQGRMIVFVGNIPEDPNMPFMEKILHTIKL